MMEIHEDTFSSTIKLNKLNGMILELQFMKNSNEGFVKD